MKEKKSQFFKIPAELVYSDLTAKEFGVAVKIFVLQNNKKWKFSIRGLCSLFSDIEVNAMNRILQSLEAKGVLKRTCIRNYKGATTTYEIILKECVDISKTDISKIDTSKTDISKIDTSKNATYNYNNNKLYNNKLNNNKLEFNNKRELLLERKEKKGTTTTFFESSFLDETGAEAVKTSNGEQLPAEFVEKAKEFCKITGKTFDSKIINSKFREDESFKQNVKNLNFDLLTEKVYQSKKCLMKNFNNFSELVKVWDKIKNNYFQDFKEVEQVKEKYIPTKADIDRFYSNLRAQHEMELLKNEQAMEKFTEYASIQNEIQKNRYATTFDILHNEQKNLAELEKQAEMLKNKRLEVLKNLNIKPEFLQMQFTCKRCKDTGFLTGGKPCKCLIDLKENWGQK